MGAGALAWELLSRRDVPDRSGASDPVALAWATVNAAPGDPDAWAALGDAQAAAGDLLAAEHAYLTAIRMGGDNGLAYARLGFILYERREDDRALAMLVEAKRRRAAVPMLDFTIDALRARHAEEGPLADRAVARRPRDAGVSDPDAGEGDASVPEPPPAVAPIEEAPPEPERELEPEPPFDGVCVVPARRIDQGRTFLLGLDVGGTAADLIIDTGASITVVTAELAEAARLPIDRSRVIRAITANGRVDFATAVVPQVVLADRVAENVRVAVCEDCVQSVADGLLGLDLVAAFGLRLDLAEEAVHFADCDP